MIKENFKVDGFRIFLNTGAIKGIRKGISDKLYDKYKDRLKDIFFNEEWHKIRTVINFSDIAMSEIISSWNKSKNFVNLYCMLYEKGLSTFSVKKIFNIYKENTELFLKQNPYTIMENVGIGFKIADKVAIELEVKLDSFLRIEAGIFFILDEIKNEGHTFIYKNELIEKTKIILNINEENIILCINLLISSNRLICYIKDNLEIITDFLTAKYEEELSNFIKNRSIKIFHFDDNLLEKYKEKYIKLSDEQINAVIGTFKNNISIITGSAGTGKTTVMKAIKEINDDLLNRCLFIAPTGRAAQRIKESIGFEASTIHKALGFQNIASFMKGSIPNVRKLPYECIIIDEISMVDLYLMRSIIEFIGENTRLILVGDSNQLPSILSGNILYDLVNSETISVFKLTKIFRQENTNEIIDISAKISSGRCPKISSNGNNISFISNNDKNDGFKTICNIAKEYFDDVSKKLLIYIITTMNRGTNGANSINLAIQEICREKRKIEKNTIKIIGKFFIFDRVIQTKNNYNLEVFNGEIGIIIEGEYAWCKVQFEDRIIEYDAIDASKLSLAYAITTHKSQGSEFPFICIPLFMEHYIMNSRQNLYTAITRASKKCIIVGEKKALFCAVQKDNSQKRNTLLKLLLNNQIIKK